ncbi:MAG: hypothetical protein KDK41_07640 [Leptospiraceae bacterium]|nr:hypothetical protein [Leptospiraceae bacterium]
MLRFLLVIILVLSPVIAGPLKMQPVDRKTRQILDLYYNAWLRFEFDSRQEIHIGPFTDRYDESSLLESFAFYTILACQAATTLRVLNFVYNYAGNRQEITIPFIISSSCSLRSAPIDHYNNLQKPFR